MGPVALRRAGEVAVGSVVRGGNPPALFNQVGIDKEVLEVGFGERLLDADAIEAGMGFGGAGGEDGILPVAGGAVAALRRPDAAGALAEVADVGGNGGANLGADTLVGAEQRHVAVGRAAGEDFDHAVVVEVAESLDDVAAEGVEIVQRGGEEAPPEARGLGEVEIAGLDEIGLVFAGGDDFASEVPGELGDEDWMGELFQQDGRQIEVEVGGDTVAFEVAEHAQQGKVGFGSCFEQPLDAMRPGAVVDDVGEVGVQGQCQKTRRSVLCLLQERPHKPRGMRLIARAGGGGPGHGVRQGIWILGMAECSRSLHQPGCRRVHELRKGQSEPRS